jgi:hypothetical protein
MSWLRRLRNLWTSRARFDPALEETLAWALDQVEPRLKQIGGYPHRYAPALSHAMAYCRHLAGQVPGPVEINRQAFTQDSLVHAIFGSPEGIVQALAQSRTMREWRLACPSGQDVFALMGMRLREKDILGVGVSEGNLQRDVPQTVVYFSDHTLTNLASNHEATRSLLERQFLSDLLDRVKDRVEAIRQEKQRLEKERDELQARLRAHGGDESLRTALNQTLSALGEIVAALDLRRYVGHFDAVLLHPEQFLHLDPFSLCLDAMGVRQVECAESAFRNLSLSRLTSRDRRHWIVLLAHIQLDELPPYEERLQAAGRWLAI